MVTPAWQSRLHAASFRGVPFAYLEHKTEGGRRLAVHEYPFKDDPFIEDIGAAAGVLQISAFVLGDNHDEKADALEDALNQTGSGLLVHPRRGEITVQLQTFSRSETSTQGGITRFDLVFIPYQPARYPATNKNTQAAALELLNSISQRLDALTKARISQVNQPLQDNTWMSEQVATIMNSSPVGSNARAALAPIASRAASYPQSESGLFNLHSDVIAAVSVLPAAPNDTGSGGWLSQSKQLNTDDLESSQDTMLQVSASLLDEVNV